MNDVAHANLPPQDATSGDARGLAFALDDVRQTFAGRGGVRIGHLRIRRGKVTALLGRSGTGKSTLLHLLGGMIQAEAPGPRSRIEAYVAGTDGPDTRQDVLADGWRGAFGRVGFVFQQPFLMRPASCRLNLAMSLSAAGVPVEVGLIEGLWDELGLPDAKLDEPARELSGGMQQRLAVARAIVRSPSVILADEPTANLDPELGVQVMRRLVQWRQGDAARSLVLITHNVELASEFADDIVVLDTAIEPSSGRPIGCLRDGIDWPTANPRDVATLKAWMSPSADQPAAASPPAPAADRLFDMRQLAALGRRAASLRTWLRLAWAAAFDRAVPLNAPSQSAGGLRGRLAGASIASWCAFGGIFLAVLALALRLAVEHTALTDILVRVLALAAGLLFIPRLLPRLGVTTGLRAIMMAMLSMVGLVAALSIGVVRSASENRLTSPDLHPLLVSRAESAFTRRFVGEQSDLLIRHGLVPPPSSPADRAMVGRYLINHREVFVPPAGGARPSCDEAGATIVHADGIGLSYREPILAELDWRPPDATVGRRPTQPTRAASPPKLDAEIDSGTNAALAGGHLYVAYDFLVRDLRLDETAAMPRWLCVRLDVGGSFAPFAITAVLGKLPTFDKSELRFVVDEEAGALLLDPLAVADPSSVPYTLLAIRMHPETRDQMMKYIRVLESRKILRPEVGFARLESAVDAARVAVSLAYAFSIVMLALSGLVTLVLTLQFIDNNRRELAVASAFGASGWQLWAFLATLLLVPLTVALVVTALFAAFVVPQLAVYIAQTFAIPQPTLGAIALSTAEVVMVGLAIVLVVTGIAVLAWSATSRSLATKLQEAA
jgi:putative ABC transport system ATP-binding protein